MSTRYFEESDLLVSDEEIELDEHSYDPAELRSVEIEVGTEPKSEKWVATAAKGFGLIAAIFSGFLLAFGILQESMKLGSYILFGAIFAVGVAMVLGADWVRPPRKFGVFVRTDEGREMAYETPELALAEELKEAIGKAIEASGTRRQG